MAISKEQYQDLKEYWDFQRKVQYNKEMIYKMAEKFENRVYTDMGQMSLKQIQEELWVRVQQSDYEDPPKDWIPQDTSLRFEWEGLPDLSSEKAVGKWTDAFNIISEEFEKKHDDNYIQRS